MRLKLTAPLHSRDGTLARGARMKNLLAEVKGDIVKAAKRPKGKPLLPQRKRAPYLAAEQAIFVLSQVYITPSCVLLCPMSAYPVPPCVANTSSC